MARNLFTYHIIVIFSLIVLSHDSLADIAPTLENSMGLNLEQSRPSRFKYHWALEGLRPVKNPENEVPDASFVSSLGIDYKFKKREKLTFRLVTLHNFDWHSTSNDNTPNELGDSYFRYSNSRYKDLWNDYSFVFQHRLSLPIQKRSQERGTITRYKGWFLLQKDLSSHWSVVHNVIPVILASQHAYYEKEDGTRKATVLYDLYLISELYYRLRSNLHIVGGFGWARREYNRFENQSKREDTLNQNLGLLFELSDNFSAQVGVSAAYPTTALKFNRISFFKDDYTNYTLETYWSLF